jgi:translation initiation factor 1
LSPNLLNPGKAARGGLVYSTEHGKSCPGCRRPVAACVCGRAPAAPAGDGVVRVSRVNKGRGGKTVTLVTGAMLDAGALAQLGTQLRRACGSGGTVKDGAIEIQGDHADALVVELDRRGFRVKRAGG